MKFLLVLSSLFMISCAATKKAQVNPQERFFYATYYFQHSAEVRALYYQAYNIASDQIDKKLAQKNYSNPCVILDADETLLDNSAYQGWLFKESKSYSTSSWDEWVNSEKASLLPGVKEFWSFLKQRGVKPVIITNRKHYLTNATLNNLRTLGISVERSSIFARTNTSDKDLRRSKVSQNCQPLVLIGDNLGDFTEYFNIENKRGQHVDEKFEKFGREFIMLPNPMYGDWARQEKKPTLKSYK